MLVPYRWLSEYCDSGLSPHELAVKLAMTGTEVERVSRFGVPATDNNEKLFQVGRVVSVEAHPNADRLQVCKVDIGEATPRTVVCGASNVAADQMVVLALPGAVLADTTKLKQAEIRGVHSAGMIASAAELGIESESEGIVSLPDDALTGAGLAEVLPFADWVLELEVTPNRPDCLGIYGVAREVHAITEAPLSPLPAAEDVEASGSGEIGDYLKVEVKDPDLCPRFTARMFTDVQVGPSPPWLKARLAAVGQHSINNVVDITNYVMFLLGQPTHAYDHRHIAGGQLVIRRAEEGATLRSLDGELRAFDSDVVLIYDGDGPNGIAGIKGGASSEITERTTTVVIEAANWLGTNILKTSAKLALRSEASTRFEKQLHPELTLAAQRLAAQLMVELCDAKLVPGTIDIATPGPASGKITLHNERVSGLLGEEIAEKESVEILERLGFVAQPQNGDIAVEVPPERFYDVYREADLIEEIARVHGLERLPATLPSRSQAVGGLTRQQKLRRRAEDIVRDLGFNEAITLSFIKPDFADRLRLPSGDIRGQVLQLENPISEDQSVMRTTLLPGLLEAVQRNLSRHQSELRLFESGRVFLSRGQTELATEHHHLAALASGRDEAGGWRSQAIEPDFYSIKAVLDGLLGGLGIQWRLAEGGPPFLHPGRAAQVLSHGHECGWIGEVHPLVTRAWQIEQVVAGFELNLTELLERTVDALQYVDLVSFPAVYQDIAVVVDDQIEAQAVVENVRGAGGTILSDARVFDLYRGDQVPEGKKSIAIRLEFRAVDRTLTDAEVNEARKSIEGTLGLELGAQLRG